MKGLGKAGRWLVGAVAVMVALIGVAALIANVASFSWTSHSTSGLAGRTPAALAQACDDIGGTLTVTEAGTVESSTCMAASGNTVACDWADERCVVECDDSVTIVDAVRLLSAGRDHPDCEQVRSLAVAFTPAAAGTPVPGAASAKASR